MSEQKRTVEQISKEYQELCLKAGHLGYQIHAITRDLELVNGQLRDLNLEAAALQKAEQAAKEAAAVEATKPVESGAV